MTQAAVNGLTILRVEAAFKRLIPGYRRGRHNEST
jgi:hypothetical protein